MREILSRYLDRDVGVNLRNPFKIETARLLAVEAEHFSLQGRGDSHLHHFPFSSIVQLIEDDDGVEVRHLFQHSETFPLVISVRHLPESTAVV